MPIPPHAGTCRPRLHDAGLLFERRFRLARVPSPCSGRGFRVSRESSVTYLARWSALERFRRTSRLFIRPTNYSPSTSSFDLNSSQASGGVVAPSKPGAFGGSSPLSIPFTLRAADQCPCSAGIVLALPARLGRLGRAVQDRVVDPPSGHAFRIVPGNLHPRRAHARVGHGPTTVKFAVLRSSGALTGILKKQSGGLTTGTNPHIFRDTLVRIMHMDPLELPGACLRLPSFAVHDPESMRIEEELVRSRA